MAALSGPDGPQGRRPGTAAALPEATIARLPLYHRVLTGMLDQGSRTVSSQCLADASGVSSAMLRKDLSQLGSYGTRGVGYDVEHLLGAIGRELGLTQEWPVIVVGVGNLGHALANYGGFASRGFRLVGLVDADAQRVGEDVAGLVVRPVGELAELVAETSAAIAMIATPAAVAQQVCDAVVAAGIGSILNFAPAVVTVPEHVDVRKVDLASELQILAFHQQRRGAAPVAAEVSA